MEAIMKNKYAKVSVVFLGAALLLSPLVMLISCKQLHKTPAAPSPPDLTNPSPENPGQGNPTPQPNPNPNPSNPTPVTKYKVTVTQPANGNIEVTPTLPTDGKVDKGSELTFTLSANTGYKVKELIIDGTTYSDISGNSITKKVKIEQETVVSAVVEAESNPTPDAGTFTDTQGNNVTIEPVKAYGGEITGYRLTGDIYIEELNSEAFKAKLDTLNGKELYTDSLNINCFTNQNSTLTAVTITPEMLNDILEVGINFSDFKLNNKLGDKIVEVELSSATNNYFDITKFSKFDFNAEFKLKNGSKIYLNGKKSPDPLPAGWDLTEYSTAEEMAKIASNDSLRQYLIVDNVKLRGNVKDLLPYLVDGDKKITEINGGIEFNNRYKADCQGISKTGYYGNTGGEVLEIKQLQELHKRVKNKGVTIYNAIIQNLDSKTAQLLKDLHFNKDILVNITFSNSNLANVKFESVTAGVGYIKFIDTTLPQSMHGTNIGELILKNVTFPKEEFINNYEFAELPYSLPDIENSLEIYGEIKDSILKDATPEQLESLVPQKNMPPKYKGSEEIYKRLKKIFRGEAQIINGNPNPNYHGSIQKQQNQLLALLQTQNKSRS